MKVALDVMGADQPAKVLLEGVYRFAEDNPKVELFVLVSQTEQVREFGLVRAVTCPEVVYQEDEPTVILRKRNSTLAMGLQMLADGQVDALISFGNTGAVVVGGVAYVKRIEPGARPAIAIAMPSLAGRPWILVDAGANADVDPEDFVNFAAYGCAYFSSLTGTQAQSVAILNVGKESHKGSRLIQQAAALLAHDPRYAGFIEPDRVLWPSADVIVTWGLMGNIFLKSAEGTFDAFRSILKKVATDSLVGKLGLALLKNNLKRELKRFDYTSYGVTPVLGLRGNVFKGHGKSDPTAVYNAVKSGLMLAGSDTVNAVKEELSKWKERKSLTN
ncbi:phosphate acyltransferase PlsX [Coprothermobacteraceae bacterium]|nr:phosphate acyltransferase PlsX [Coprothermobacteraceae bacterium]